MTGPLFERAAELERELAAVINKCGVDAITNTPDHVLARYLVGCIETWDAATRQRDATPPIRARPSRPERCGDMVGDGIRCNLPKGHRMMPGQPNRCSNSDYF